MLDNTLSQVHFLYETEAIDRAFAQLMISQITSLVHWLEQAAEQGRKTPLDGGRGAIFTVHHNEIIYSNNIILLEGKQPNDAIAGLIMLMIKNRQTPESSDAACFLLAIWLCRIPTAHGSPLFVTVTIFDNGKRRQLRRIILR